VEDYGKSVIYTAGVTFSAPDAEALEPDVVADVAQGQPGGRGVSHVVHSALQWRRVGAQCIRTSIPCGTSRDNYRSTTSPLYLLTTLNTLCWSIAVAAPAAMHRQSTVPSACRTTVHTRHRSKKRAGGDQLAAPPPQFRRGMTAREPELSKFNTEKRR
jgi:hypothetical protein